MVILWVCYGYPMVLTAVYTIILITDFKKGAPHRCPFVVFYARLSGIDPSTKHRIRFYFAKICFLNLVLSK